MSHKQGPTDLALLAAGLALVVGSFSPWISVAVMSISGIDGWRGYVTLGSGLVLIAHSATRLWQNLLDVRLTSKLALLSKLSLAAALVVLVEVAGRLQHVTNELSDSSSDSGLDTSTDTILGDFSQALDEFTKLLTDALRPRLAVGWYVCVAAVVSAAVLMFLRHSSAKKDSVEPATA